jgi:Flp pilus assembly protein TadB
MKKILLIMLFAFVVLATGCQGDASKKNTDKSAIDNSAMTKTEQKANKTKQEADELNKELDDMIHELNNEK